MDLAESEVRGFFSEFCTFLILREPSKIQASDRVYCKCAFVNYVPKLIQLYEVVQSLWQALEISSPHPLIKTFLIISHFHILHLD
jgi:hypothetical protein